MIDFVIGLLVYIIVSLLFLLAKIHWVDLTKDDVVDCAFLAGVYDTFNICIV